MECISHICLRHIELKPNVGVLPTGSIFGLGRTTFSKTSVQMSMADTAGRGWRGRSSLGSNLPTLISDIDATGKVLLLMFCMWDHDLDTDVEAFIGLNMNPLNLGDEFDSRKKSTW